MKTLLIALIGLTLTSVANAAPKKPCPQKLNEIRGRAIKLTATKLEYEIAKDALAHYRSENMGGYNNRPYIEEIVTYRGMADGRNGFKIVLTDGGDESTTTYYLDGERKLIYAFYSNQSPVKYWFCGQKTALEIYE